jgi:hypothetical protein
VAESSVTASTLAAWNCSLGGKRDLGLVVGTAHPRALHANVPATEPHLTVLVAVSGRYAISVVLALRADRVVDLFPRRLAQHAEPDAEPALGRRDL